MSSGAAVSHAFAAWSDMQQPPTARVDYGSILPTSRFLANKQVSKYANDAILDHTLQLTCVGVSLASVLDW